MLPPLSIEVLAEPGPFVCEDGAPLWVEDEYPDFDTSQTFVISGPIGDAKFRGRRFDSWEDARDWLESVHSVVKFGCVPEPSGKAGRWIARVRRKQ